MKDLPIIIDEVERELRHPRLKPSDRAPLVDTYRRLLESQRFFIESAEMIRETITEIDSETGIPTDIYLPFEWVCIERPLLKKALDNKIPPRHMVTLLNRLPVNTRDPLGIEMKMVGYWPEQKHRTDSGWINMWAIISTPPEKVAKMGELDKQYFYGGLAEVSATIACLTIINQPAKVQIEEAIIPRPRAARTPQVSEPKVIYKILEPSQQTKIVQSHGGTHASPHAHWRKAHTRRLRNGKILHIAEKLVNEHKATFIDKEYLYKSKGKEIPND